MSSIYGKHVPLRLHKKLTEVSYARVHISTVELP